jgi:excinuclease ABC subunit C
MPNFQSTIKNLPQKPGVYRYYDKDGGLLYIGKAKNLKNRVSSYFQEGRPKNQRLTLMISRIDRIEYTVVASEKESLILEANLIHNLQPKYNILLKDDKSYVYVRITNDTIPAIFLVRKKYDPSSLYFGPYTKQSNIYNTLRTLRTIFPYCQERSPQKRPCSYYGIKQCEGICVGKENLQDYNLKIKQIQNVLEGKTELVETFVQQKIGSAVEDQNFALAAMWRDRLNILQDTIGTQKIILPKPTDLDLITLVSRTDLEGLELGSIFVQNIRGGKLINVANYILAGTGEAENESDLAEEFLQRFFQSYYVVNKDKAPVLVQCYKLK